MHRRSLLAALAALIATAAAAPAPPAGDTAVLGQVQDYLNALRSLKARFFQIAPNGQTSQGTVWLERPGRMRFQYDPPSPLLLVAGGGLLVFHDSQLGQTSNIPLSQTPLGILLADDVRLSGPVTVTGMRRLPGMVEVTVVRNATVGDGSLTMVFADNPLMLRQWTVVDAQRQETRVSLSDVQLGGHFKDSLFEMIDRSFPNGTALGPGGG